MNDQLVNNSTLSTLPNQYKGTARNIMELVEKSEQVAIYKQTDENYYEVFMIKTTKPSTRTIGGKEVTFKGGEQLPNTSDFGLTAWATRSMGRAEHYRDILLERIKNKPSKVVVNSEV